VVPDNSHSLVSQLFFSFDILENIPQYSVVLLKPKPVKHSVIFSSHYYQNLAFHGKTKSFSENLVKS